MKSCFKCKESKPFEAFSKNKRTKDGYQQACKVCSKAFNADYYKRNAERICARNKAWAEANPEKDAATRKAYDQSAKKKQADAEYRLLNREKLMIRQRDWRAANPEGEKRKSQKWSTANRDIKNAGLVRYRTAKLKRLPLYSDDLAIKAVYAFCKYLRQTYSSDLHVDHIYPLRGNTVSGLHVAENLQLIPYSENCSKGNRLSGDEELVVPTLLTAPFLKWCAKNERYSSVASRYADSSWPWACRDSRKPGHGDIQRSGILVG